MFLSLAFEVLFRPKRAAVRITEWSGALGRGIGVYTLSIFTAAVFYTLKPRHFPEDTSFVPLGMHGPGFWTWVGLVGLGVVLAGALVIWALLRIKTPVAYSAVAAFAAWMHLFYFLMFVPLSLAAYFQNEAWYRTFEYGFSLWGCFVAVVGVSQLGRISLPRSLGIIFVSALSNLAVLWGLYALGCISSEAMKVLLFL